MLPGKEATSAKEREAWDCKFWSQRGKSSEEEQGLSGAKIGN